MRRQKIRHANNGAAETASVTRKRRKRASVRRVTVAFHRIQNSALFLSLFAPLQRRTDALLLLRRAASMDHEWVPGTSRGWIGNSNLVSNSAIWITYLVS